MKNKLTQKVAVVTGGTSGIGFAIANEFIAEGAKRLLSLAEIKNVLMPQFLKLGKAV